LHESVVSYAIEYFGWETPFGEFFVITPKTTNFRLRLLEPIPFAELHRLSYRWLKLVKPFWSYSTQHLSWKSLFPPQIRGFSGITPQIKSFSDVTPKGTSLAQTTSSGI
jgi:hypothetical protein